MAHFAQLDKDNTVLQVIVVANEEIMENGIESETKGTTFCKSIFGEDTVWVQTSRNRNFRKNFGGFLYVYDSTRDAFIAPKPFESWILDEATCQWQAPTPYPTDDKLYTWDEPSLTWLAHP
jgi:hypothetical protein